MHPINFSDEKLRSSQFKFDSLHSCMEISIQRNPIREEKGVENSESKRKFHEFQHEMNVHKICFIHI